MKNPMTEKGLLSGLRLVTPKLTEAAQTIINLSESNRGESKLVFYLNLHTVSLMVEDSRLKQAFKAASAVYFDGWGAVWLARLAGINCKERTTTADFFDDFCARAEKKGLKLFLLGSKKSTIKRAVDRLEKRYDKIKIVGYGDGYFKDSSIVNKRINRLKPDYVVVGMGSPKQELWLHNNRKKIQAGVCWTVGSLFEYVARDKPKAPGLVGKIYLEWLFRIGVEPMRLWNRYIIDLSKVIWRLIA